MTETPTPETFECFAGQAGEKMCMGCLGEGWGECIYKKYKDTQADLTERARAIVLRCQVTYDDGRGPGAPSRIDQARITNEIIAALQSEREAAAAEARPIVEAVCRYCLLNGTKKTKAHKDLVDAVQALFDRQRALASPAPQEAVSDKLERALQALYLELPEAVARDFSALVRAEIAALTEQRDRAMKVVRDAYRVIQHTRAIPYRDSAGLRIIAMPAWEDFEAGTLAALDTPSSPSLPESPIDG